MGMDLIYAPAVREGRPARRHHRQDQDWPELKTASPGHMTVATYDGRLYGVPLYADVSALFYNKDLFQQGRARPRKAADEPRRDSATTPTRSPRSAAT